MATTSNFTTGLLGYDPRQRQLDQQKLWANMYSQAQSPYAQIGMGVGQLLGAGVGMLTGGGAVEQREKTLLSVKEAADQQFTPGTAEYYKFVIDNLPADAAYSESKDVATQEYLRARKAAIAEETAERKSVREDPESLDVFTPKYAQPLLAKATSKGFNPETEAVPQTTEEIKAFAKLYDLDKDPNYNKLMSLRKLAEKEAKKEQLATEKGELSMEQIRTNIKLDNARLNEIGRDDFDKGTRWNEENAAARAFLKANKIDTTKPLTGGAKANPAFVNAYQKALRNDWLPGKGITSTQTTQDPKMIPIPVPRDPKLAVVGQVYATPRGNAQWDGSKFNIVK